ncbi:MAG: hypothetical protein H7329_19835 [Opitutaceae bacterium]|nr:hypothetical protein [Cytophagales bacterium]
MNNELKKIETNYNQNAIIKQDKFTILFANVLILVFYRTFAILGIDNL